MPSIMHFDYDLVDYEYSDEWNNPQVGSANTYDNKSKTKELYGWFSKKQADELGKIFHYLDMDDNKVEVTLVTDTKKHGCGFDDIEFVGKVYKCEGSKSCYKQTRYNLRNRSK